MATRFATALYALLALTSTSATAQDVQPLNGIWRSSDGGVTVRIEACPQSEAACATVVEEQLKPGESSMLNQMVVKDMRPDGNKRWRGRYIVDGHSMKATARLGANGQLSMRVCAIAFLCDTIRLDRLNRS